VSDFEVRIGGERVTPADGWRLEWDDRERGAGRLLNGHEAIPVLVEGAADEWVVTLRGRRISVAVQSWRERLLAEVATSAAVAAGPVDVRATLPGLVVGVAVEVGAEVGQGDPLLTIEAMKMQNEVRAPRPGRVIEIAVEPGAKVATGAVLLRLE